MTKDKKDQEGFDEYKHLILERLQDFKDCMSGSICNFTKLHESIDSFKKDMTAEFKKLDEKIGSLEGRLITVEVKSGIWGTLGGALASIVTFVSYYLTKGS